MAENEKQEETQTPEELPLLKESREIAERMEKANEEARKILEEQKAMAARTILGGKTDNAPQPAEKKEETPAEYARRVERGEVR